MTPRPPHPLPSLIRSSKPSSSCTRSSISGVVWVRGRGESSAFKGRVEEIGGSQGCDVAVHDAVAKGTGRWSVVVAVVDRCHSSLLELSMKAFAQGEKGVVWTMIRRRIFVGFVHFVVSTV